MTCPKEHTGGDAPSLEEGTARQETSQVESEEVNVKANQPGMTAR